MVAKQLAKDTHRARRMRHPLNIDALLRHAVGKVIAQKWAQHSDVTFGEYKDVFMDQHQLHSTTEVRNAHAFVGRVRRMMRSGRVEGRADPDAMV